MDPNTTMVELFDFLADVRKDTADIDARNSAVERLRSIATWLQRGGFPPSSAIDLLSLKPPAPGDGE